MSPPTAPLPKKNFARRPEWIAAILITAATAALHFYFWLHAGGLWRDEVNSINVAAQNSFAAFEKDSFPILTPLLLHGWLALGLKSDLGVRLFGLLVGLGILATLWISIWKIRRAPPLLGLVLFALNCWLLMVGDSIRAYGLGSLLAIALTASAFVFLKQPSWPRTFWLALFAILSVQTLYHNPVLVAVISFGAWAVCWRRKKIRAALQIFIVAVLSAASLLPYAHNLFAAGDSTSVLRTGVKWPRFFSSYADTFGYPLSGYIYVWALLMVTIIVLACAGFGRKNKSPEIADDFANDANLFAAVALTLATIGFFFFFWFAQMPMEGWYLLPFMALVIVCCDAALPVFHGIGRAIFFGFVVATALISIPTTARILKSHFSDVNLFAKKLSVEVSPKDYIVVLPWFCGISFDHYFHGATQWDTLPPLADHSTHRYDLIKLQLQNTNAIAPVLGKISTTLQSGHRVWILADAGWMGVPDSNTPAPKNLPPAPLKNSGWSDRPYELVWASQVGHFLGDHAAKFVYLKNPASGIQIAENMELFMADGWKTNALP